MSRSALQFVWQAFAVRGWVMPVTVLSAHDNTLLDTAPHCCFVVIWFSALANIAGPGMAVKYIWSIREEVPGQYYW